MVQIIQAKRKPTFVEKLNSGMANARQLIAIEDQKKAELAQEQRKFEQAMKLQELKGQQDYASKLAARTPTPQEKLQDLERYETIKNQWGDEAADLYKAAPEGGKTELIRQFIDMQQRGIDVSEKLKSMKPGKAPGYTPKEEVTLGKERYAQNLPLYEASATKLKGYQDETTALDILSDLSPQISGLERLNISPQSGELLVPALASPEAQRYVKTINDFTTKAKDSYGSRVTNFDLTQFMKRLPTLANSEEGRTQIIDQMRLLNGINQTRQEALINYVDEQGGVRNVDWDRAEREADKRSKSRVDELKKEFTRIERSADKNYNLAIKADRELANKKGMVLMELNGQTIFVPKSDVAKAKKKGAKAL